MECGQEVLRERIGRQVAAEEPDHRHPRLLRASNKRPRRRTADKPDKIASSHWSSPGSGPHCVCRAMKTENCRLRNGAPAQFAQQQYRAAHVSCGSNSDYQHSRSMSASSSGHYAKIGEDRCVPIAVVSGLLNSKKLLRCTFGDNLERRPKCWIGVLRVGGIVHVASIAHLFLLMV